jgi:hypothetical protein
VPERLHRPDQSRVDVDSEVETVFRPVAGLGEPLLRLGAPVLLICGDCLRLPTAQPLKEDVELLFAECSGH